MSETYEREGVTSVIEDGPSRVRYQLKPRKLYPGHEAQKPIHFGPTKLTGRMTEIASAAPIIRRTCPVCGGSGRGPGGGYEPGPCLRCKGTGEVVA